MNKAKEISALWKQIKPQIGELARLCHEVEDHAEVTADAYQRGYEEGYKDGYNEPGKGKIQVGDEVNAPFGKAIVVNIDSVAEKIWLVYADGHGGFEYFKDAPTKTGRHFTEIAEVLAKMKETDNG